MTVRSAPWRDRGRSVRRRRLLGYRRAVATGSEQRLLGIAGRLGRCTAGAPEDLDVAVRQRLLDRLLTGGALAELRVGLSGGRAVVAVPRAWARLLQTEGVRRARVRSRLGWWGELSRALMSGVLTALRLVGRGARGPRSTGPYAVALALPPESVTPPGAVGGYDFATWLARRLPPSLPLRVQVLGRGDGETGAGGPTVVTDPLPGLEVRRRAQFAVVAARLVTAAAVDAGRGRWWTLVLLRDRVEAAYLLAVPRERRPTAVVAHNGSYLVRPLWTDEVERAGGRVELVFYATNVEHFEPGATGTEVFPGYHLMTWPHCLVWDEPQAAFVRGLGTGAEVEVVGVVDFAEGGGRVPPEAVGSVAVFDVTPQERRQTVAAGRPVSRYYSAPVVNRFLDDVLGTIEELDLRGSFKQKREIGTLASTAYRVHLDDCLRHPGIVEVPASVSARRLLEHVAAAVSLPFTSTALIARETGVPSAFYDPTASLDGVGHLARGIPVLTSRGELKRWLADVTEARA